MSKAEAFRENESFQAEWRLKFRAKYELENFIDKNKASTNIFIIGENDHTEFLYKKIYYFNELKVVGYCDFLASTSPPSVSNVFDLKDFEFALSEIVDIIFVSSHEYQLEIIKKLESLGIEKSKIFVIYDTAADDLTKHAGYLPDYNEL